MELSKFCPRCGKETDRLFGDKKQLCADCYPDKNDLLDIPDKVEIDVCSVCGRMRDGSDWVEEYSIQEQLGLRFSEFSRPEVYMEIQYWEDEEEQMWVRVHAEKGEMEDSFDSRVVFNEQQCDDCARFNGSFFKVKMQLRGDIDLEPVSNKIADKAAEVTNEDRKSFLSNIEKNSHGFNFFMSTERMAKQILNMLKASYSPEVQRSYELVGEEDGEKVYRNVISVRITDSENEDR
ncbi:MAG: 60S ribosomal export protein NMD3 [Candidatus Nanohalobium sp.]